MRRTARYLFLGGPLHGHIRKVDIYQRCMPHIQPKPSRGKSPFAEKEDFMYVKKQVVAPWADGRSIPVFVDIRIADVDKWLDELPSAVIDQLWPKMEEVAAGV